MNAAKEYQNRHQLKTPTVMYVPKGVVFMRSVNPKGVVEHNMLRFNEVPDGAHPGKYVFSMMRAVPNGIQGGKAFSDVQKVDVEKDQYEGYWFDFCRSPQNRNKLVCFPSKSVYLFLWEVFCVSCDSNLGDFHNREELAASLNESLPLEKRHEAFLIMKDVIGKANPQLNQWWEQHLVDNLRSCLKYSQWVHELSETFAANETQKQK